MRTLVISDLHLGNRAGRDVLRRPEPRARLLEAIDGVDRLVLLGDLAELVTRSPRRSLAIAEPVLRAIGQRMGNDCQVIVVPGNHDGPLIRAWARNRGRELGVADTVPSHASRALERVVSWLGGDRVSVRYPGVWLDERTYATHGHYLDDHLMPSSPVGLPRGRLNHRPVLRASVYDYDRRRIRSHHRRDAWLSRRLQRSVGALAAGAQRALLPRVPDLLLRARLTPVTASLADLQARHAALPALGLALARLGVGPDTVIFGHIHRRGPLGQDRMDEWRPAGGPQLFNSGSWHYEPLLLDSSRPPHPYWPGGAIVLEEGAPPRSIGLLDDLDHAQLGGRER